MLRAIYAFLRDQAGQDLAEWCLITALVALASLGLYYRLSGGMHDLWSTANSTLVNTPGGSSSSAPSTSSHR